MAPKDKRKAISSVPAASSSADSSTNNKLLVKFIITQDGHIALLLTKESIKKLGAFSSNCIIEESPLADKSGYRIRFAGHGPCAQKTDLPKLRQILDLYGETELREVTDDGNEEQKSPKKQKIAKKSTSQEVAASSSACMNDDDAANLLAHFFPAETPSAATNLNAFTNQDKNISAAQSRNTFFASHNGTQAAIPNPQPAISASSIASSANTLSTPLSVNHPPSL